MNNIILKALWVAKHFSEPLYYVLLRLLRKEVQGNSQSVGQWGRVDFKGTTGWVWHNYP